MIYGDRHIGQVGNTATEKLSDKWVHGHLMTSCPRPVSGSRPQERDVTLPFSCDFTSLFTCCITVSTRNSCFIKMYVAKAKEQLFRNEQRYTICL